MKFKFGKILFAGVCGVMTFLVACGDSDSDVAFRRALCALAVWDRQTFSVAGADGNAFSSLDGGLSFSSDNTDTESDITDYDLNAGVAWSVGKGGYLGSKLTINADYDLSDSGTTEDLNDIKWITPSIGLAVGNNGAFTRSIDAGLTWNAGTIGDGMTHFRGLDCADMNDCWAVGSNMGLYWTGDQGATFMKITPNLNFDMSIDFTSVSTPSIGEAWIAGHSGKVLRTTDMGNSFSLIESGTTNNLHAIYVGGDGRGLVGGDDFIGRILDEEIDDLTALAIFIGVEIKKIQIALTGGSLFLAGSNGALFETPDVGQTFISIPVIVGNSNTGDMGDMNDSNTGSGEQQDVPVLTPPVTDDSGSGGSTGSGGTSGDDLNDDMGDTGGPIESPVEEGLFGDASFVLSDQDFSFLHNVGSTECEQKIGEFTITNDGDLTLDMTISVTSGPLRADPNGGFSLEPGESRTIMLFFTCAQASSFQGGMTVTGVALDGTTVSQPVSVVGNVN